MPELRFFKFEDTWEDKILGEVSNVQTGPFGSQLKNEQYITGGTPVVTVEHIKDFWINSFDYPSVTDEDRERLKKYSLKSGDLVFSRVGSVDLSACVEDYQEGWLFSSRMLRVRPNKQLKPRFLAYFLQQIKVRRYIVRISVGSTMPSLNTEILQSLPIKYCSIAEQQKIASFLGAIDTRLTQLRRKHKLVQTYKRGVMQKLFSQQIRFKCDDGQPFPDWEEKRLESVCTMTSSKRIYLEEYVKDGIPFYRGKEVTELKQGKKPNDILYISRNKYEEIREKYGIPITGDILITAVGTLGNVWRINRNYDFYFKDGNLIWLKNISTNSIFLAILLQENTEELIKTSIGSTQKALTIVELKKISLNFPCLQEQEKIADFLTAIDQKIEAVAKQIDLTEQFKKGLLQKMFV